MKVILSKLKPTQILMLGFALLIALGTLLLTLPVASQSGQSVGVVNALFTATSAVCVTGLAVVNTLTRRSGIYDFDRCLIYYHWAKNWAQAKTVDSGVP